MAVNAATGSTLFVSTTPWTNSTTLTQYAALTYTEVGEIESIGEWGDESADITFTSLKDARTRHKKGARDAGTMSLVVGADPADAGQALMVTAEASKFDYAFKVVENDQITPSTGNPTTSYFHGQVRSKKKNIGDNSNITRRTFEIGVNSETVEKIAT